MKAQLIVVVGKPEGQAIPLSLPQFKIGRGVGCQLRPTSDQVSREHALFEVTSDAVYVQDLGSRNGTEVNGKRLSAHEPYRLKNGELVKIGLNTFAVSIEGAVEAVSQSSTGPVKKASSLDDVSHDDIGSWLVTDASKELPKTPSGVYGGETMTFEALKAKDKPASMPAMPVAEKPASKPAMPVAEKPASKPAMPVAKAPEPEPEPEAETETEAVEDEIAQYQEDDGIEDLSSSKDEAEIPEEFVDESNPFYVKKTASAAPAASSKEPQKDSSDAAHDILRRMMDRRKASKS